MIHILDLEFLGHQKAIAAFIIETSDGPVLVETGPHSTYPVLESRLKAIGLTPGDIRHVLLSHIHFDHAGAAWALAGHGATVYVHPFGAPHLEKPMKLVESARMIYKDQMDPLWGEINPIQQDNLVSVEDGFALKIGDKTFVAHHTPGHAKHHIAWQLDDVIFTGDVAGCKIDAGPVVPPCPPPDINIEDWKRSIDRILKLDVSTMYLTHYGVVEDKVTHMHDLTLILDDWAHWIREKWESGMTAEEITPVFMDYTAHQLRKQGVDESGIARYEAANPSWMSVSGLIRYWKKRAG